MNEIEMLREWLDSLDKKLDQAINKDCRERHAALDREITAMKVKLMAWGSVGIFAASIIGNIFAKYVLGTVLK